MPQFRTVLLPYVPPPPLLRALHDVRSAVNRMLPDWRAHPEESRFDSTKRWYSRLRATYGHLASGWVVASCNEASATLNSWDRMLRRARRHDRAKFERMKGKLPHRARLKASLHPYLYRLRDGVLDVTVRPDDHVRIDLRNVHHPRFSSYLQESEGKFGLAVTDRFLVFNFRLPRDPIVASESAGVDLNMPSADFATSTGKVGAVDLRRITAIQGAMDRKRRSVQRSIPRDLRAQRRVLRRYRHRERHRVMPPLHRAANELLAEIGEKNVVLEDLSVTTEECLRSTPEDDRRRRLSAWTHGQFARIVGYKARTAVVRVNPRGSSSECPRCGGPLAHPEWRRATCGHCQGVWHRDRAAAIVVLDRGLNVLRGAAPPPSARDALLEAAAWRSGSETTPSPTHAPMKGDDANER